MKRTILVNLLLLQTLIYGQTFDGNMGSNSLKWNTDQKDFNNLPRVGISPMSLKLWDNYDGLNAPSRWGSLLEINGREGHLTSQLYFSSTWEGGKMMFRSAFYAQNSWEDWRNLLDSRSDVESSGNLKITGTGNSYILNGNVGIGTINPQAKLHVEGSISGFSALYRLINTSPAIDAYSTMQFVTNNDIANAADIGLSHTNDFFIFNRNATGNITLLTNGTERVRITGIGNVGIGSTNPDSKLTVKGKIHAEEVKIDLAVPADYVFEKYYLGKSSLKPDYTLLSLSEVEKFTEENHHLPNVPSAKEIKENGLIVGEMSNVLLQKIEELTLYAIKQEKKNNEQAENIKNLDKQIELLKRENEAFKLLSERLSKLENLSKQ